MSELFAKSAGELLKEDFPANAIEPTPGFGLTLDKNGRIPNAQVLAPHNGVAAVLNTSAAGVTSWASAIGRGTSLPASPTDGQEYILVDSLTSPTYQWRFCYSTSNTGSYKWEFVGGPPKQVSVLTSETTTSATYADLSTVQSFTFPRSGQYLVQASCITQNTGTNVNSMGISNNGSVTWEAITLEATVNQWFCMAVTTAAFTGTATQVLKAVYQTTGGTATFAYRGFNVTPVSVS